MTNETFVDGKIEEHNALTVERQIQFSQIHTHPFYSSQCGKCNL